VTLGPPAPTPASRTAGRALDARPSAPRRQIGLLVVRRHLRPARGEQDVRLPVAQRIERQRRRPDTSGPREAERHHPRVAAAARSVSRPTSAAGSALRGRRTGLGRFSSHAGVAASSTKSCIAPESRACRRAGPDRRMYVRRGSQAGELIITVSGSFLLAARTRRQLTLRGERAFTPPPYLVAAVGGRFGRAMTTSDSGLQRFSARRPCRSSA